MNPEQIVLELTVVLFSISFAWMVGERINSFPKIRRFGSIYDYIIRSKHDAGNRNLYKDSFLILIISWGLLWAGLALSIRLLIRFSESLQAGDSGIDPCEIYLVPFLFLLAPHFISRLISSVVLAKCDNEVKNLIDHDPDVFNCYAKEWKVRYGLEKNNTRTAEFKNKAWARSASSFLYGLATFVLIFWQTPIT